MSYDFTLRNEKTGKILELAFKHDCIGGTYQIGGTNECWLNVTYNYSRYFYEASEGDNRFLDENGVNVALNALEGMSALKSIPLLECLIKRIKSKYMVDDEWLKHERVEKIPFDKRTGEEIVDWQFNKNFDVSGVNWARVPVYIDEGDTSNYWKATAKNAVRALEELLYLAKQRPDGVWSVQ